jgi:hypothetical protein
MAYNPPIFKPAPVTTNNGILASNFSGLRVDGNRVAMTGTLGNYIQTRDATGTPLNSPLSVSSAATIAIPKAAAQITISSSGTCTVSEDSTSTASFALPANTIWTFDCANMTNLYLTGSSITVNFYFTMV